MKIFTELKQQCAPGEAVLVIAMVLAQVVVLLESRHAIDDTIDAFARTTRKLVQVFKKRLLQEQTKQTGKGD